MYEKFAIGFAVLFFFQAEDGIRDLVRSRGLGDVYKRQNLARRAYRRPVSADEVAGLRRFVTMAQAEGQSAAVSYTHLTLPTSDLV